MAFDLRFANVTNEETVPDNTMAAGLCLAVFTGKALSI